MAALDPELEEFRLSIRRRADRRIEPLIADIDRTGQFSQQLWDELRDAEIFALPFAAEYGGADGGFLAFIVAVEELARAGAIAGLYPGTTVQVANTVITLGTDAQKARWLPLLVSGQRPAAWAFTEPQTGSDPRQIETTASRDGDGWILNGRKLFISYARQACVTLVFARTGSDTLGGFLVPTDTPGYSTGEPFHLLGMGGGEAAPVFLDDVRLDADALLGDPARGFEVMLAGEAQGKVRASAINIGIAARAVEESARYALGRLHRGTPIADRFSSIQGLLGEMEANVLAARSLVRDVARLIDDGAADVGREAAAARIVSGRCAREATSSALQICGAYGWTTELPVERLYREAKFFEVTQGVTEIQRSIVARYVLADHRHSPS